MLLIFLTSYKKIVWDENSVEPQKSILNKPELNCDKTKTRDDNKTIISREIESSKFNQKPQKDRFCC